MSAIQHGDTVKISCTKCLVTGEIIIYSEMAGETSVRDPNMIRSRFLKVPTNNKESVEVGNEEVREEEGE